MANDSYNAFVNASAGAAGALFSVLAIYPLDFAKVIKQAHAKRGNKSGHSQRQGNLPPSLGPVSLGQLPTPVYEGSDSGSDGDSSQAKTGKTGRHSLSSKSGKAALAERLSLMHAESESLRIIDIFRAIVEDRGLQGLFTGVGAKCFSTVASAFAYFYCYSFLKSSFEKKFGKMSTTSNLLVASAAGALNMTLTLPLEVVTTRVQTSTQSAWEIMKELLFEEGFLSFWKGYIPSLILVSNPAINYTLFDRMKIVALKIRAKRSNLAKGTTLRTLTVMETFLLAAVAKIIATLVTYPLIRAKVLMQVEKKMGGSSPSSMSKVLQRIGKREGIRGYYMGCNAQLFNTVLKSVLMLVTKEQIDRIIRRSLYALRNKRTVI